MRLYFSGATENNDPRSLVPDVRVMKAFNLPMRKLETFDPKCFLDSGAFALRKYAVGSNPWSYYNSRDYFLYLDHYANVDVIGNAELTWRNQQYLEDKGLHPVPVIHFKTNMKWVQWYLDHGYRRIGLGGLVGSAGTSSAERWLYQAFELMIGEDRCPLVQIHGFGIVNYRLLLNYPWWSVDSAAAIKESSRGCCFVPHCRGGEYVFWEPPTN